MGTFTLSQSREKKRQTIYPIGKGIHTNFTVVGETNNYESVDDDKKNIDNDSTYVYHDTESTVSDTYVFENIGEQGETITAISSLNVIAIAKSHLNRPVSTSEYKIAISDDGWVTNIDYSDNKDLVTSYIRLNNSYSVNPLNTPSDFTETEINNLRFGLYAKSDSVVETDLSCTLRPNAAGDLTDTSMYPDTGEASYEDINDETSDKTDTYIFAEYPANQQTIDLFNVNELTSCATDGGTISHVAVVGVFQTNGIGNGYVYAGLKVGGTEYWKPAEQRTINVGGSSWLTKSWTWDENPDTSTTWAWSDFESLQIGIDMLHSANTGGECRCTQLYLVIYYNIAAVIPEIRTTAFYADVLYDADFSIDLQKPEEISTNHTRNIKMLNFWNSEREVYDLNRSSKTQVMRGFLYGGQCGDSTCSDTEFTTEGTMSFHWGLTESWSSISNAYDGNTGTYASIGVGEGGTCYFSAPDITYPVGDACITKVEIRYYAYGSGSPNPPNWINMQLYARYLDESETGRLDLKVWAGSAGDYDSDWVTVTAPTEGWTLNQVKGLSIKFFTESGGDGWGRLKDVSIKVTYKEVETYSCCDTIKMIRSMGLVGDDIIITGLTPNCFNGTFKLVSFGWNQISKTPIMFDWIMQLEDVEK